MTCHVPSVADSDVSPVVRPRTIKRTAAVKGARMAPGRLVAAEHASALYDQAIAAAGSTRGEVARSLAIDESAVRHWCDPGHAAAITLRDIMAGPGRVRESLAHALLALGRAPAPLPLTTRALLCAETISAVCGVIREITCESSPGGKRATKDERRVARAAIDKAMAELQSLQRQLDAEDQAEKEER